MSATATLPRVPASSYVLRLSNAQATIGSELNLPTVIHLNKGEYEWTSDIGDTSSWRTSKTTGNSLNGEAADQFAGKSSMDVEYQVSGEAIAYIPWATKGVPSQSEFARFAAKPDSGTNPASSVRKYRDLEFYPSDKVHTFHAVTMDASGVPTDTVQPAGQLGVHPPISKGPSKRSGAISRQTCFSTGIADKLLFNLKGEYGVAGSVQRFPGTLRVNARVKTRPVPPAGSSVNQDHGEEGGSQITPIRETGSGGGAQTSTLQTAPSDKWVANLGVD